SSEILDRAVLPAFELGESASQIAHDALERCRPRPRLVRHDSLRWRSIVSSYDQACCRECATVLAQGGAAAMSSESRMVTRARSSGRREIRGGPKTRARVP